MHNATADAIATVLSVDIAAIYFQPSEEGSKYPKSSPADLHNASSSF